MDRNQRQPRYGLHKLKIGVVSVVLGFTFLVAANPQVQADKDSGETNSQGATTAATDSTASSAKGSQSVALKAPTTSSQAVNKASEAAKSPNSKVQATSATSSTANPNSAAASASPRSSEVKQGPASPVSGYANSTYSNTPGYQANYDTAYANMAKLQPLSQATTIVHDGNLIDTNDPLYQATIIAAAPVDDNNHFIVNAAANPQSVTGLVVNFADGQVKKYRLAYQGTTADHLLKYQLPNGANYLPLQSASVNPTIVNDVVKALNQVDLFGDAMKAKLAIKPKRGESTDDQIRDLYLTNSFNQVKAQLTTLVPALLANSSTGHTLADPTVTAQKIKDNQLAVMLGLSYINRLYNIQFGQYNILPLMMFRPDFFGGQIDGLDWIIKIGNLSASQLTVKNNLKTFNEVMAPTLHTPALISFLALTRQRLAPGLDAETWFRSNTGAYIYEVPSQEVPSANVHIYHRLSTSPNLRYRGFILPLLNMKDNDMYIVTTMATTTYGLPDRYINQSLRSNPTAYQQQVQKFDQGIKQYADDWGHYFDFWYRMTNDNGKKLLLTRNIPIWDSYWIQDSNVKGGAHWVNKYDTSIPGIAEFFGPVGDMYGANGTAAYANGSAVHFVVFDAVGPVGTSTMTHEMTHNFDGSIYFDGYDRRQSEGAESFAEGLLQSVDQASPTAYGLNLAFDYRTAKKRTTNESPDSFKTPADVGKFMHGVFDVTYLLDYAEAEAMLPQSVADKELVYNQINYDPASNADVVTTLDDSTAAKLTSLDSLIDNNIIAKRSYRPGKYGKNVYETISLYGPDYAGLENPNGSTGGITFRKTAFELLAAKGWQDGFLSYVSNEYKQDAAKDGQAFSDQYILNKMFNGKYQSYAAFKKDMFAQRIAKKDLIKPITISFNRKTVKINNYQDLATVMDQAVQMDLSRLHHGSSQRYVDQLKQAVMQAYNDKTNAFSDSSIFKAPATAKLTVNFVDANQTARQDLSSDDLTLSGDFNSAIGNQVSETIAKLEEQGYTVISNDFANAGHQFNADNDGKAYTVKLAHLTTTVDASHPKTPADSLPDNSSLKYPTGLDADSLQKTVQRTITITLPHQDPKTTHQVVHFTRTATVDEVTGQVQYSDWQTNDQTSFPITTVPTVAGYTASLAQIPAWDATADSANQAINVTYQLNQQYQTSTPLVKPTLPAYDLNQLKHSQTGTPLSQPTQPTYDLDNLKHSATGQPLSQPTKPSYDLNNLKHSATGDPLSQPTLPAYDLNQLKHSATGEPLSQPTNPAYDLNKLKNSEAGTPLVQPTLPSYDLNQLKHSETGTPLTQPTNPAYDLGKLNHSETGQPLAQPTLPAYDLNQLKHSETGQPLTQPSKPTYDLTKLEQTSTAEPLTEPTQPSFDLNQLKQTAKGDPLTQPTKPAYDLTKLKQSSTAGPLTQPTQPSFDLNKLKQTKVDQPLTQPTKPSFDLSKLKPTNTSEQQTKPNQPAEDSNKMKEVNTDKSTKSTADLTGPRQQAQSTAQLTTDLAAKSVLSNNQSELLNGQTRLNLPATGMTSNFQPAINQLIMVKRQSDHGPNRVDHSQLLPQTGNSNNIIALVGFEICVGLALLGATKHQL